MRLLSPVIIWPRKMLITALIIFNVVKKSATQVLVLVPVITYLITAIHSRLLTSVTYFLIFEVQPEIQESISRYRKKAKNKGPL